MQVEESAGDAEAGAWRPDPLPEEPRRVSGVLGGAQQLGEQPSPPTTMEQRLLQPWLLSICRSPICVSPTPLGGL